ncbi:thiamine-phosphate kinase [Acidothermaceae bacterium B102]|nr:thiamine-phosphate kinase [Acidothermaceae bacterium B102]
MDVQGGGGTAVTNARLTDVGEFGLIERVLIALTETGVAPDPEHGVLVGPGDDAAVVSAPDGRVVVSTDVLVDGRHFRRDWSSAFDVGVRAAAANLADIAAMGAHPTALTVALAAPLDLPVAWILELARGLAAEAAAAGAVVVGGDMARSNTLVVSVTALGRLDGRPPVLRSGAHPGDLVVLAGRLGWAAAGLRLLVEGIAEGPLVDAHRRPLPPYGWGPRLAALGATAMLDVSDGLLQDAGHLARASGVAVDLQLEALRTLGGPGILDDELLTGGDDHPLLATLPAGTLLEAGGPVVVGLVREGAGVTVDGAVNDGPGGHDHFPAA